MRRFAHWKRSALAMMMTVACMGATQSASAAEEGDSTWGRWAPADRGMTALDFRIGMHMTHVTVGDTAVGNGKRGAYYGFRSPTVWMPELTFSAFTSKHLSLGVVMQTVSFGSQDAPVVEPNARHTRSPMVLGLGAVVEAGYSVGPFLFRPGMATGPRAVMLLQDRSGKQSPPAAAQWFMHVKVATEIELSRSFALGIGASTDALRPMDWGAFTYLSWRFNDVRSATQ